MLAPAVFALYGWSAAVIVDAQTTVSVTGAIVSVTGANTLPLAIGPGYQALAVSWTQASATRVSISATITGSGSTVTAYLTTQIGPGTTAANEIAETTLLLPNNYGDYKDTSLFNLASLPAGTYFLTLNANGGGGGGWAGSFPTSPSITTGSGASANGYYVSGDGAPGSVAAYPPASNFNGPGPNRTFYNVTGTMQVQVPFGDLYCAAGANGLGNIYDPTTSSCASGVVVPFGDLYCPPGLNGPGYLYDPATSTCVSGVALPFGDLYCAAGVNGPGNIYDPATSYCAGGIVVPSGDLYCSPGARGPGYLYDPAASYCMSGVALPVGDSYCAAGVNGPGNIYDPATSYCASGIVVPSGDLYCPAGANGTGGLYNSGTSSCVSGIVVPSGDLYCPAGANGTGGLYNSGTSSCVSGIVVPYGGSFCSPGVSGPGGLYNPSTEGCNLGVIYLLGASPSAVAQSQVTTTASGLTYSRVSQTFNGTVTFKNIGTSPISGPFEILLTGLPANVVLVNATVSLSGSPLLTSPAAGLTPGQSATVSVRFKSPSNSAIHFTPVLYSGSIY